MSNNQNIHNNNNIQNQNNDIEQDESAENSQDEENQQNEEQYWEQQENQVHREPLTEEQMKQQIRIFFHLYVNPILIFGCLSFMVLESNQIIYFNELIQKVYAYFTLASYFVISMFYCCLFLLGFKQGQHHWKKIRIINYLGIVFVTIQIAFFITNSLLQKEYQDLIWTRRAFTILFLTQYTHLLIQKLYGQVEQTLHQIFNRIYFLAIPLSKYEKENSFASLQELYLKLKIICQPLSFIYFLIQIAYQIKMFIWLPSMSQINLDQSDHQYKYLMTAIDQMKTVQVFSCLLILGLISTGLFKYLDYSFDQQNRLPAIILFMSYQIYFMTFKFYLSALVLNGEYYNLEKILAPLFMITLMPLLCTLFLKRALTKLYRLPLNDSNQMQQQQIELFSQYKLEYQRNLRDAPDYVVEILTKQQKMYFAINIEMIGILFILFIYQFVNINQLFSLQHQETIGLQIQAIFDMINGISTYITLNHFLIFLALSSTAESILNQSEYGVFSFIFIANYLTKIQWNSINIMSLFIIVSYILNITDSGTYFHLGPLLSILWMLVIYFIKCGIVPSMVYEFAKSAKLQFHFGELQARLDALYQQQNQNNNQQQNQPQPPPPFLINYPPINNSQSIQQDQGSNLQPIPLQNISSRVYH